MELSDRNSLAGRLGFHFFDYPMPFFVFSIPQFDYVESLYKIAHHR